MKSSFGIILVFCLLAGILVVPYNCEDILKADNKTVVTDEKNSKIETTTQAASHLSETPPPEVTTLKHDNTTIEPTSTTVTPKPTIPTSSTEISTTTTTKAPDSSSTSTTPKPITTTPTATPGTTSTAAPSSNTTTTEAPKPSPNPPCGHFDGPSFIGGIVLTLGLLAIGLVAYKFYKARNDRNYHTL